MTNQPTEADLLTMTPAALLDYYDELQAAYEREVAALTAASGLEIIEKVIQTRFEPALKLAVDKDTTKKHGKFAVPVDPQHGIWATATIRQTVAWDQDKLKALAATMPWADVKHYFDIKFSVKESVYKAVPPSPLKVALDDARTTMIGGIAVELERKKAAA